MEKHPEKIDRILYVPLKKKVLLLTLVGLIGGGIMIASASAAYYKT